MLFSELNDSKKVSVFKKSLKLKIKIFDGGHRNEVHTQLNQFGVMLNETKFGL